MFWVFLTVICYTLSSLGDKQISANLKCRPGEFAFLVSAATAAWMVFLFPFSGWRLEFNAAHVVLIFGLVLCKLAEFYASAVLLESVSAYELKAWLAINIVLSYICNIVRGKAEFKPGAVIFCLLLLVGIIMIVKTGENPGRAVFLSVLYVLSKFVYGFLMGMFSEGSSSLSILFVVMILTALIQIPRVKFRGFSQRRGMPLAVLSRIPNTLGLLSEAQAAVQNIFLYAMIQPVQLLILFVWSLKKREVMSKVKLAGSIFSILAACLITVVIC